VDLWDWYQWLRAKLLSKVGQLHVAEPEIRLVEVERALFFLDASVPRPARGMPRYSWSEYSRALDQVLLAV